MNASDLIFIGANFRVTALRKDGGQVVWETVLVTGIFNVGESFVSLVVDKAVIYAHTKNESFCLDLLSGKILWQTKLPNLGRAVASIAMQGMPTTAGMADAAQVIARAQQDSSGD